MSLLPVEQALDRLLSDISVTDSENIAIADAGGRTLASPIYAKRQQSPFDASAMDGYALRALQDGSYPNILKVIGESAAGKRFSDNLGYGECIRIFTGAPVPADATAIMMQENTKKISDHEIELISPVIEGRHIRKAGLDFNEGDLLLETGRTLDPIALALAASSGNSTFSVYRPARVAILATGNELVKPDQIPGIDQIISSNSYGVAEIARQQGAQPIDLGIIPDNLQALVSAVQTAIEDDIDVLVISGGASVGDHDLVHKALAECGIQMDFWKIAMRPGKPLMSGRLTTKSNKTVQVIGLPGNPVSSLVCSYLFLSPLLAALNNRKPSYDIRNAILTTDMPANDHRQDYVRAQYDIDEDYRLVVKPLPVQDSSMLSFLAKANALIIREPNAGNAKSGDKVKVMILR